MALCYYHPLCEKHDPGPDHSENARRLVAIHQLLQSKSLPSLKLIEMPVGKREIIELVHTKDYVDCVFNSVPITGYKEIEINEVVSEHDDGEVTVLSPQSGDALMRCAGGIVAAVDAVMTGADTRAFCATRPPGHHALTNKAMGFCVFNHTAIAARYAQKAHGIGKVAIIDFDVHHANGTQQIFENDPNVFHASIHQLPLWPETGHAHEVGCGNLLNIPLAPDTSRDKWLSIWRENVLSRIDQEKPEIIIIAAGFDAHRGEPKARQNLETEDYYTITCELVDLADRHAKGRIVSVLEGGYNVQFTAESCMAHLRGLGR